jgi:hypothetical protein
VVLDADGRDGDEVAFASMAGSDSTDFTSFNSNLQRLLRAQGRCSSESTAIGGLPAQAYWATAISGFEPTMGYRAEIADHDYIHLDERNPAFWVAFAHYALHMGVTPEMALAPEQLECASHFKAGLDFIGHVERQVGESCAQVFLALHREHAMSQVIGRRGPTADKSRPLPASLPEVRSPRTPSSSTNLAAQRRTKRATL